MQVFGFLRPSYSNASAVTDAELRHRLHLGGALQNRGESYPILKWPVPNAVCFLTLPVMPMDAEILLEKNGTPVALSAAESSIYTYTNVQTGLYTYSVTYSSNDYAPQSGTVFIGRTDVFKSIELELKCMMR